MLFIGIPLGILSENPDGLERVLIDQKGEIWLENLVSPWIPFLSWIQNDYIAGALGVIITMVGMTSLFYFIAKQKKEKKFNKIFEK